MIKKEYFPNGSIKSEAVYDGARLHGLKIIYYDNGQVQWRITYWYDLPDGEVSWFSRDGKIHENFIMKRGNGVFKDYYEDGSVKSEIELVGGRPFGLSAIYDEKTRKKTERYSVDGRIMTKKKFLEIKKKLSEA